MIGAESKRVFTGFSPLGFYYGLPYQPVTAGSNPARFRKGIDCSKTFKNPIFRGAKMRKSELQELTEMLGDIYGSGRHYEIIKAEKTGQYEGETNGWTLTIKPMTEEPAEKKDEGADNESDK